VTSAAAVLAERGPAAARVGVVLGSGLGAVADAVEDPVVVGYDELPGFPRPSIDGHAGRAVLGHVGGVPVAVLQGRSHLYEGGDLEALRAPVRALRDAGAEILILTNAAGSLRPEVGPGRLMAIVDHINMTGVNLLVGPNDDAVGPRFPSLKDAYDPALLDALRAAAAQTGVELAEGVYLAGAELRDARRDPRLPDARRRCRRHVDRAGDDPRPTLRPTRRRDLGDQQSR
jgi:xanthosine phosphorylase